MRCFDHPDREAVGVCKSCQKGLCGECAVDLGQGLACRGRCEETVRGLIALIAGNLKARAVGSQLVLGYRRNVIYAGAFLVAVGSLILSWGALAPKPIWVVVMFGALFLVYGAFQIARGARLPRPVGETPR